MVRFDDPLICIHVSRRHTRLVMPKPAAASNLRSAVRPSWSGRQISAGSDRGVEC
jgi:hypothetical protein